MLFKDLDSLLLLCKPFALVQCCFYVSKGHNHILFTMASRIFLALTLLRHFLLMIPLHHIKRSVFIIAFYIIKHCSIFFLHHTAYFLVKRSRGNEIFLKIYIFPFSRQVFLV